MVKPVTAGAGQGNTGLATLTSGHEVTQTGAHILLITVIRAEEHRTFRKGRFPQESAISSTAEVRRYSRGQRALSRREVSEVRNVRESDLSTR
ncbi:hypothetical protein SRHO_G00016330 [Serrasalmus rhombeus]